jgi:hypothetical protein
VVIGGEQGDQAEEQAADGLDEAEPIEAGPGTLGIHRFWRSRRLLAGTALGIGHGLGGCSKGVGANRTGIAHPFSSATIQAVCLERFDIACWEQHLNRDTQARTLDWLSEKALADPVAGRCGER